MLIRRATEADGETIGRVHVRSWQATYRGIVPDDVLDALDPVERGQLWRYRVSQLDETRAHVLVVERDEAVVGFAAVGVSGDGGVGEVFAIYLDPDVIGTGVGRALFAAAGDALRDLCVERAVLWVAEANAQARRFYEVAGWHADGDHKSDTSFGAPIVEVRYSIALDAASATSA